MVQAKDQALQSLQHEVEAKEHQLRRLNKQLESNEEITATLHHTITQRDREIAELRQSLANEETNRLQCQENSIVKATDKQLSMSWKNISDGPKLYVGHLSTVVGENAYFTPRINYLGTVWECTSKMHWNQLSNHPLSLELSLVGIENELTTVGGIKHNRWVLDYNESNKLYRYIKGKWVEKYPPM